MTPAEARKRIMELGSEVAEDPDRASELTPQLQSLARIIQEAPQSVSGGTITKPVPQSMCVAHDKVCRKHQICNAHPKANL